MCHLINVIAWLTEFPCAARPGAGKELLLFGVHDLPQHASFSLQHMLDTSDHRGPPSPERQEPIQSHPQHAHLLSALQRLQALVTLVASSPKQPQHTAKSSRAAGGGVEIGRFGSSQQPAPPSLFLHAELAAVESDLAAAAACILPMHSQAAQYFQPYGSWDQPPADTASTTPHAPGPRLDKAHWRIAGYAQVTGQLGGEGVAAPRPSGWAVLLRQARMAHTSLGPHTLMLLLSTCRPQVVFNTSHSSPPHSSHASPGNPPHSSYTSPGSSPPLQKSTPVEAAVLIAAVLLASSTPAASGPPSHRQSRHHRGEGPLAEVPAPHASTAQQGLELESSLLQEQGRPDPIVASRTLLCSWAHTMLLNLEPHLGSSQLPPHMLLGLLRGLVLARIQPDSTWMQALYAALLAPGTSLQREESGALLTLDSNSPAAVVEVAAVGAALQGMEPDALQSMMWALSGLVALGAAPPPPELAQVGVVLFMSVQK